MSIQPVAVADAFGSLPTRLREQLLDAFSRIVINFREGHWEPSELNGGKLCEVVYSVLNGIASGSFPASATKPRNFVDACKALESATSAPHSVRITVPRVLVAMFEFRNNRGAGHVGGDVDPNHMDATFVLYASKWVMAELVRLLHSVSLEHATSLVEKLIQRELPAVWPVADTRRVLLPGLTTRQQVLLLLYHEDRPVMDRDLASWVNSKHLGNFRRDVLVREHDAMTLHYDQTTRLVHLSPVGTTQIEETLLRGRGQF